MQNSYVSPVSSVERFLNTEPPPKFSSIAYEKYFTKFATLDAGLIFLKESLKQISESTPTLLRDIEYFEKRLTDSKVTLDQFKKQIRILEVLIKQLEEK